MKQSEYAVQLQEKQKAKYTYGILERQFSNLFKEASRRKGITGENLLMLCESRLDNTVFRLGIAPTRRAARQLVGHRHITVNGEVVNIPSYQLKAGDKVAVREKSKSLEAVVNSVAGSSTKNYAWLEFDKTSLEGTFIINPTRDQIPENIREQLIVELYSK
jgi:small subunit ribosomal protein S4